MDSFGKRFVQMVAVLGAGGFVGRNLARELGDRFPVLAISRKDFNLLDSAAVERFFSSHPEVTTVIHCAVVGGSRLTAYDVDKADVVEQNLRMYFNVARCLKPHQRLIYFGSGAEYARPHYQPKMGECFFDSHVPADAYGFAKYSISQHIGRKENMLDLRIFGLYGPGEDYRYKFISNAIVKALLGLPITIAQNVVFDYLYIADFVRLVEKLLDCDWPYRHMNITPTQSADLVSLAEIINEVTGNKAGITVLNPGWNTEYTGDNRKLLEVVGPFDFTSYREGIRELAVYYQSVWDSLDLDVVRADPFLDKCIVKR